MIEIEKSSGNVYDDLGLPDAEEMFVKARLATKISEIIKHRHLTQQEASKILGMPQSKISNMQRRNIAELLGNNSPPPKRISTINTRQLALINA
jgi:predicted XRE-type DNA-binding protein